MSKCKCLRIPSYDRINRWKYRHPGGNIPFELSKFRIIKTPIIEQMFNEKKWILRGNRSLFELTECSNHKALESSEFDMHSSQIPKIYKKKFTQKLFHLR